MTVYIAIDDEVDASIRHCVAEMRRVGSSRGAVSAYPRQLESLIRLAEAHAKMRFANIVENIDVEEARR